MTAIVERPPVQLILANGGLFATAVFWGSNFPLLELLLRSWDPLTLNAGRVAMGAFFLLVVLHLREGRGKHRKLAFARQVQGPAWGEKRPSAKPGGGFSKNGRLALARRRMTVLP